MCWDVLRKLNFSLRYLGNKTFLYWRGQSFPTFFLRQCVVELLHFRLWLIQGLSYISMVICLNIYFPSLIRVIALCKVKGSGLGSHCSSVPLLKIFCLWADKFQVHLLTWNCMHRPRLPKGNGTCKLSGLQWSVGAEKRWLTMIMRLLEATAPCRFSTAKGGSSYSAAFLPSLL